MLRSELQEARELLRREARLQRRSFQGAERRSAERSISQHLINFFSAQLPKTTQMPIVLGAFRAFDGEPSLEPLITWVSDQPQISILYAQIPEASDGEETRRLSFVKAERWTTWRGSCPQPVGDPYPWESLTHILVPGLLFDKGGYRIGLGAGYYDQTLSQEPTPCSVGVAFAFQRVEKVPRAPWESPLSAVVCERGFDWSGPA